MTKRRTMIYKTLLRTQKIEQLEHLKKPRVNSGGPSCYC